MTGWLSPFRATVASARARPIDPPVTIAFASARYQRILANWLAHAHAIGVSNVLLLALDRETVEFARRAGVDVARLPSVNSRQELWKLRVAVFVALAEAGVKFIHSDLDAVWLAPPYGLLAQVEADIVFSQGTIWPPDVAVDRGFVVCCGFFAVRSVDPAAGFFRQVQKRMHLELDDQVAINRALYGRPLIWGPRRGGQERKWDGGRFTTYFDPLVGADAELRVALLPHRYIPRLPEINAETIVVHPVDEQPDPEQRLRALGLWRLK